MREIRLGLKYELDISQYANPKYSYEEMREKRKHLYQQSPLFDPYEYNDDF